MIQDKMKLNDDKAEFLIIGTSQQLKKVGLILYLSAMLKFHQCYLLEI